MKDTINQVISICLAFDDKYADPARVVITSILCNALDEDSFDFYILDAGISDVNKAKIEELKSIKDFSLNYYTIDQDDFNAYPVPTNTHFRKVNYYRLIIPSLFPNLDKAIYLDVDTIVKKSLRGLFNIDISNYFLAAAKSSNSEMNIKRMELPETASYFNSGVLLINCKKWRQQNIEQEFFKFIKNSPLEKLRNVDQDVINGVLYDSIYPLPQNWNVETRNDIMYPDYYKEFLEDPYINHYCSSDKPWNQNTKQDTSDYRHYLEIADNLQLTDNYDLSKVIQITTRRFDFDLITTPNYAWKYTDIVFEEMSALLIRQIAKGIETFVDIGAHYGFYSTLVGLANPDVDIYAFEPIPENYEILKKNLDLNGIKAKTIRKAISNTKEKRPFQVSVQSSQSGFIANPDEKVIKTIIVNTETLDEYLDRFSNKSVLIKMDTEGNEIHVLEGMENLLQQIPDIRLLIEFNPSCLIANGTDPQDLLDKILDLGFDIYVVCDMELQYRKFDRSQDWQSFMGERTYRNLFCVRNDRSLSVCFFSHSSGLAGSERSLLELTSELIVDYGALCTVVLPSEGPLVESLEKNGISTIQIPTRWWCADKNLEINESEINNLYLSSFSSLQNNLSLIEQINPDVIITNSLVIPWGALSAYLLKKPHLWNVTEFGEKDHNLKFFYPFPEVLDFIYDMSDRIVTNSLAIRKTLFGKYPSDKLDTIYRYIEIPEKIKNVENKEQIFQNPEAFHLIIYGSVVRSKGQEDAVRSITELIKNRHRNVELSIVGPGDSDFVNFLGSLISKNGLNDEIHMIPFTNDILFLVESADAVLVCSQMEGFGRVTLEGMLLEKPIVATNTGGTPELVKDGKTGLLYTPGNYNQLADQIEKLMDNPSLARKLAHNGYSFAKRNFTKQNFGGKYHRILKEMRDEGYRNKNSRSEFLSQLYHELLFHKENEFNTLNKQYDTLNKQYDTLNKQYDTLNKQYDTLNKQFFEEREKVKQLECQIIERNQYIHNLESEMDNLQIENVSYVLSTSWRITRPLRRLVNFFRRIQHVR
ncbi:MAG TPA: hypothetical protein DCK95_09695 [Anaerolineaceae bacterium]|nr:hypothetical protein [Anaerolineaceae bacterium]